MKTMTDNKKEAESLYGLFRNKNNVICEKVVHTDGTIEYVELELPEDIDSITDRFKDTDTIPHDWKPEQEGTQVPNDWKQSDTNTLEELPDPLTRDERVQASLKLELLLVKIFGTHNVDTKGNQAFKAVLIDLCKIAGGSWAEYIKKIK